MEVLKYRLDAESPWQEIIAIKGDKGDPGLTEAEVIALIRKEIEAAGGTGGNTGGITPEDSTGLEYQLNSAGTQYTLIGRGSNTDAEIVIPSQVNGIPVVAIGEKAFFNDTTLTKITFPNTLTTIGLQAFRKCSNLGNFIIPNSVITIGNAAFAECNSITEVAVPSSVTNIGAQAFYACSGLERAVLGCPTIQKTMFGMCRALVNVTIENTVTTIAGAAFYNSAVKSLFVPSSVKTLGGYADPLGGAEESYCGAFYGMSELTSLRVGWAENARTGAPWDATNATITYNAVA